MQSTRNYKHSIIAAILALVMLISSLIGTTFAWFTDSVTSAENKIEAGSLKVDLLHETETGWVSIKTEPDHKVFDYNKWEPGYTQVETLKIENQGSLALKYRLSLELANGTALTGDNGENLADVIDVYVIYGESSETTFNGILANTAWVHMGTLTEVFADPTTFINGSLLPTGKVLTGNETGNVAVGNQTVSIALHMRENAGNGYQNLSVGDIFVSLIATQYTYEEDSFGPDYDGEAGFPTFSGDYTTSTTVETNANDEVIADVIMEIGGITAVIRAGTKMKPGVTTTTLAISTLDTTEGNVVAMEGQAMQATDVHIEGFADDNTVPAVITLPQFIQPGYNEGNYQLYHVENGASVPMALDATVADLNAHNEFTYDPVTGNVSMALCSFSEVTLVYDQIAAWEGKIAKSFAAGSGTEADPYIIANADQLAYFARKVGGMLSEADTEYNFADKYVKLICDIDLGYTGTEEYPIFYPIGAFNNTKSFNKDSGNVGPDGAAVYSSVSSFSGTFDGNGNTIKNFYQNTWDMFGDYNKDYSGTPNHYKDGMGLFGYVLGGTVKNLTVEGFSSDGEFTPTGVIAAFAKDSTFENIAIFNCNPRVYNTGNGGIVGIACDDGDDASHHVTLKDITIDNTNKISALWGSYDVGCGGFVGMLRGQSTLNLTNCHVAAQLDVNNDVCGNYQYYIYRYAGMLVGSVFEYNNLDTRINASGVTYTIGDWNEYWYCELVSNSIASYTHDHQFSRLTKIASLSEIYNESTGTWLKKGNFVIPNEDNTAAVCYHVVEDENGVLKQHKHEDAGYETGTTILKEDNRCVFLPFNQLMNGYGWGERPTYLSDKNIAGYNYEFFNEITETCENGRNAAVKFVAKQATFNIKSGAIVQLSDLFTLTDGANAAGVDKSMLQVFVSPVEAGYDVKGDYDIDLNSATSWADGRITFTGTGAAKIVITDYWYCIETTLYVNVIDNCGDCTHVHTLVDGKCTTLGCDGTADSEIGHVDTDGDLVCDSCENPITSLPETET